MKLNVPFYSQNDSSIPEDWKSRSCAIVCLKMCIDAYGEKHEALISSIPELINEGLAIRGEPYTNRVGWNHDAMVWLAHNHGVPAYKEEFRSDSAPVQSGSATPSKFSENLRNEGLKRIKDSIERGVPVVVSFLPGFGSKENVHHLVVIGFEEATGFIVHDPSDSSPKEAFVVSEDIFIKFWRKFAIFVG